MTTSAEQEKNEQMKLSEAFQSCAKYLLNLGTETMEYNEMILKSQVTCFQN